MPEKELSEDRKKVRRRQINDLIKKDGNHLLDKLGISINELINSGINILYTTLQKIIKDYLLQEIKKINTNFIPQNTNIYFLNSFLMKTQHDTETLNRPKTEIDLLQDQILRDLFGINDVDMKSLDSLMELYKITDEVDKCLYLKYVFECIDAVGYTTTAHSLKLLPTTRDKYSYFFIHYLLTMCYLLKLSIRDGVHVLDEFKNIDNGHKFRVNDSDSESLLHMDHEIGTFLKSGGQDDTMNELIKTLAFLQLKVLIKQKETVQKPLATASVKPPKPGQGWNISSQLTETHTADGTHSPLVAHRGHPSLGYATQAHKNGSKEKKYLKYKRKYLLLKNKI